MALLPILHYPDPRLKKHSLAIETVDDEIKALTKNMLETMYDASGIGLAAPQVNRLVRLIVVDVSKDKTDPLILINPKIQRKNNIQNQKEGCLSIPGIYAEVERAEIISVTALNENNESIVIEADGLLAVCIQHEIDHLDGTLFVDYLSKMKQARILKKMKKMKTVTK